MSIKNTRIICFTGLSGSGKSKVIQAFKDNDTCGIIRLGNNVRKLKHMENFCGTTEEYAEKFRFSSVCEFIIDEIHMQTESKELLVIDSVRTISDYLFFKEHFRNVKLIMIIADRNNRLEWLNKRNRTGESYTEFKLSSHDYWELDFGISNLLGLTDKFFINEGSIDDLQKKVISYVFS